MSATTVHEAPGERSRRGFLVALAAAAMLATSLAAGGTVRGAEAEFPVTIVDDEGTEVTIEAEPQRIVSFSPANTEIVFALGAGDRLLGGSDFDDYPPEAVDLPDVVTFNGVILETVVDLDPDLILAAGNNFTPPDDIARLRELGYPVVVVYAPDVPTVLTDIDLIGRAIGEGEAAASMTAAMAERIAAIEAGTAAIGVAPRTYYELDYFEGASFAPAPESFVEDMVELAGGDAITTGDPAVFQMSLEELVVADPEVIVLGDAMFGHCPDSVAARPGWGDLTAVQRGDVRPVDGLLITRPGPRLADGLASLARAIHPELELAEIPAEPELCPAA